MPRGVYDRKARKKADENGLARLDAAAADAAAAAADAADAAADATELNTTTPSTELRRLLTLERDRHLARARIIDACLKALE